MGDVIDYYEERKKRNLTAIDEIERQRIEYAHRCNALFHAQHSDDDSFENINEFEFTDRRNQ